MIVGTSLQRIQFFIYVIQTYLHINLITFKDTQGRVDNKRIVNQGIQGRITGH